MKIVFFGTPEFAVASLERLVKDGREIAAVVTMPDKIGGRGHGVIESDVKKYAVANGLRVLQPANLKSSEFIDTLRQIGADLFIIIAFRMLPEEVWSMPSLGTFNLHASLLPKYRGAAPINRVLMNGEEETGVTTFFLKHEIDTGDIIEQRKIIISDNDNAGSVHDKLMELGAEMVSHTVGEIEKNNIHPIPQPEGEYIPAPKIFKQTCRIDWNKSAKEIHNHIRGLSPYPGAWSSMIIDGENGRELEMKIISSTPLLSGNEPEIKPGEIKKCKDRLLVACGKGWLELGTVQPSGKKRMNASDFLLGYKPVKFL